MSLIKRMIEKFIREKENYNDENLRSLDEQIAQSSKRTSKTVTRMIVEHTGPSDVTVTEGSMKNLADVILK